MFSPRSSVFPLFGFALLCFGSRAVAADSDPSGSPEVPREGAIAASDATPDTAQEEVARRAEQLKARADALFRAREYVDAVALYDQAHALSPDARLLYNKARALQALGRFAESYATLRVFESQAPADLRAQLGGLEGLLRDLRQRLTELRVQVNVPGAKISLGSQALGHAPLDVRLVDAGAAQLRIEKEGYFAAAREVTLEGGGAASFDIVLESKAKHAKLTVLSGVPGTTIHVNERNIGVAPSEVVLTPGAHRVLARRSDHEDAATQVVLEAGQQRTITLDPLRQAALYERWWFWGAVGVTAAAAVVTVVALTSRSGDESEGNFSPSAISAPLVAF